MHRHGTGICNDTCTCMDVCMDMCIDMCMDVCIVYPCVYPCLYTYLYTCLYTCLYPCLYTCSHMSIDLSVHMYIHISIPLHDVPPAAAQPCCCLRLCYRRESMIAGHGVGLFIDMCRDMPVGMRTDMHTEMCGMCHGTVLCNVETGLTYIDHNYIAITLVTLVEAGLMKWAISI